MSSKRYKNCWVKYAENYDPIKVGSIDGLEEINGHDSAVIRAVNSTYHPPEKKYLGKSKATIFIGRLNIQLNEKDLLKKFKKFGTIEKCRVVRDIITGISKCYAFIAFKHKASAKEAVNEMNGKFLKNCQILVDYECERRLKGWKPRRLGGGFGGRKESGQLRFGCIDRPFQKPFSSTVGCSREKYGKH